MTLLSSTKSIALAFAFTLFSALGWAKDAPPPAVANPAQALEEMIAKGKGFTVGTATSTHTVYVMFDAQCPHCSHLWKTSQPLLKSTKFVWMPVAILNAKSAPQGAALLGASDPAQAMAAHEASLLAGKGGVIVMGSVAPAMDAAIKGNNAIFNQLKVESVPFIITQNARTGEVVSTAGALETKALADFIGADVN